MLAYVKNYVRSFYANAQVIRRLGKELFFLTLFFFCALSVFFVSFVIVPLSFVWIGFTIAKKALKLQTQLKTEYKKKKKGIDLIPTPPTFMGTPKNNHGVLDADLPSYRATPS